MHRILHIIPSLAPSGAMTQLVQLIEGLPKDEFEFHVLALSEEGHPQSSFPSGTIKPVVLRRRWPIDPLSFWQLKRHIQRLRPALVHTWDPAANTYGRTAALAAGVRRLVATERHIDSWKSPEEFSLDRWLAARTSRIIANSAAVRDFYVKLGLPSEKIAVIPPGVLVGSRTSMDRTMMLSRFGLSQDIKLIAYAGSLTKHKRLKELIWATDQLKAVGVLAHLLIAGAGPLRPNLQRFAWLNRVHDRVHFMGPRGDVLQWLGYADVLWQAGAWEGQSQSILEAMAAGVPVVAADSPGNRELVEVGETGYLVPLKERAGFARNTLPLMEDAILARRLGIAGQQRAAEHHQVGKMLARHTALYRELLA